MPAPALHLWAYGKTFVPGRCAYLARMFFASVGYSASDAEIESQLDDTSQYYTASKITNLCIDHIIDWVANQRIHHASEKFNRRSKTEPR